MSLYYIGKTQKNIESIENLAGSHTIFGINNENSFACLLPHDENKPLTNEKLQIYYHDLRYGMETYKFLDSEAKFIFDDKKLFNELMKIKVRNTLINKKDIIFK